MARPQQRPARNRRAVTGNAPKRVPPIAWYVSFASSGTLCIAFPNAPSGLALSGIPAVLDVANAALPVGAVLIDASGPYGDGNPYVQLTYAAPVGITAEVAQDEPAVRASNGAYLQAGSESAERVPAVPVAFYGGSGTLAEGVNICVVAGSATLDLPAAAANGIKVQAAMVDTTGLGGELTVQFAGSPVGVVADQTAVSFTWDGTAWS